MRSRYWCAGISRHEAENAKFLRERTSDPLGPESCADTARDSVKRRQGYRRGVSFFSSITPPPPTPLYSSPSPPPDPPKTPGPPERQPLSPQNFEPRLPTGLSPPP